MKTATITKETIADVVIVLAEIRGFVVKDPSPEAQWVLARVDRALDALGIRDEVARICGEAIEGV